MTFILFLLVQPRVFDAIGLGSRTHDSLPYVGLMAAADGSTDLRAVSQDTGFVATMLPMG